MNYKYVIVAFAALLNSAVAVQKCPTSSAPIDAPCYYKEGDEGCEINCGGTEQVDFTAIFTKVSQKLPKGSQPFHWLLLNNTAITELPANVFAGIQFKKIAITRATSLRRINVRAFNGTETTITILTITVTPVTQHVDEANGWDLFGAIRTITSLDELLISQSNITQLPTNSLNTLANLSVARFVTNPISTILPYAFSDLPELTHLQVYGSPLAAIDAHAFKLGPPSTGAQLNLQLESDELTVETMGASLAAIGGRTTIVWLDANPINYLDEKVFEPFFALNVYNFVNLPQINCTDSRNEWVRYKYPAASSYMYCPKL